HRWREERTHPEGAGTEAADRGTVPRTACRRAGEEGPLRQEDGDQESRREEGRTGEEGRSEEGRDEEGAGEKDCRKGDRGEEVSCRQGRRLMLQRFRLDEVDAAAALLHGGGMLAYPTEAVFGLGCDP